MEKDEFAWRLYESERDFIKHHENQRTNASSILAAVYAALVVALSSGLATGSAALVIAATITIVGIFGAVFSGKLYELIQMHALRSYVYLELANAKFPELDLVDIKASIRKKQKSRFPLFSSISLNKIWFNFHALVAVMGVILFVLLGLDMYLGANLAP